MVCLKHTISIYILYPFKFFKGRLPQILLGRFLNTLPQLFITYQTQWTHLLKRTNNQVSFSPSQELLTELMEQSLGTTYLLVPLSVNILLYSTYLNKICYFSGQCVEILLNRTRFDTHKHPGFFLGVLPHSKFQTRQFALSVGHITSILIISTFITSTIIITFYYYYL